MFIKSSHNNGPYFDTSTATIKYNSKPYVCSRKVHNRSVVLGSALTAMRWRLDGFVRHWDPGSAFWSSLVYEDVLTNFAFRELSMWYFV